MEIGGYDIFFDSKKPIKDRVDACLKEIKKVWPDFYFNEHNSANIFQPNTPELWTEACQSYCFFVYENKQAVAKWDEDVQPDNTMLYFLNDQDGMTLVIGITDEFSKSLIDNLEKVIGNLSSRRPANVD